jgi:Heparinase II/III-like protein
VRMVADAGPLGYLSIAAHGHADALAFTLSAAGRPLLVDPGTYAYHTERDWRDHFRGTAAHNTVCVDGLDQSEIGGNFMWLRKAQATLHEVRLDPSGDVWDASHDGYARLPDPVRHRRRIEVHHDARRIVVTDTLHCLGEHRAEVCWQFAEGLDVTIDGNEVRVRDGAATALTMHMHGASLTCRLLQGSTDPKGGWVSPSFGIKRPAPSIRWEGALRGTTQWRTEIRLHATPAAWSARAQEETAT